MPNGLFEESSESASEHSSERSSRLRLSEQKISASDEESQQRKPPTLPISSSNHLKIYDLEGAGDRRESHSSVSSRDVFSPAEIRNN